MAQYPQCASVSPGVFSLIDAIGKSISDVMKSSPLPNQEIHPTTSLDAISQLTSLRLRVSEREASTQAKTLIS
jgi:hypothetical protein